MSAKLVHGAKVTGSTWRLLASIDSKLGPDIVDRVRLDIWRSGLRRGVGRWIVRVIDASVLDTKEESTAVASFLTVFSGRPYHATPGTVEKGIALALQFPDWVRPLATPEDVIASYILAKPFYPESAEAIMQLGLFGTIKHI